MHIMHTMQAQSSHMKHSDRTTQAFDSVSANAIQGHTFYRMAVFVLILLLSYIAGIGVA